MTPSFHLLYGFILAYFVLFLCLMVVLATATKGNFSIFENLKWHFIENDMFRFIVLTHLTGFFLFLILFINS